MYWLFQGNFCRNKCIKIYLRCIIITNRKDKKPHPIAFYLKTFLAIETNYKIYNKELLLIVDSFQEWCHCLEDALSSIIMYMDHKNLKYFITHILNFYQGYWSMFLSKFEFKFHLWTKKITRFVIFFLKFLIFNFKKYIFINDK